MLRKTDCLLNYVAVKFIVSGDEIYGQTPFFETLVDASNSNTAPQDGRSTRAKQRVNDDRHTLA